MRFLISCFILVVGVAGCDLDLGPCGLGCPDGETCGNNGCEPCGGADQICCKDYTYGGYCTAPGYGCQPNDGLGTCSKDCGSPGKRCCEDAGGYGICDGQAACAYDMCPGTVSDPCDSGSTLYTFTLITANCAAVPLSFKTNSLAEAQQCLDDTIALGPGEEMCDANVPYESAHVCEANESFGWTFAYCSAAQLAACEANVCGEASCTWGECP